MLKEYKNICYKLCNAIRVEVIMGFSLIALIILTFLMCTDYAKSHVPDNLYDANYAIRMQNIEDGIDYNNGLSGYIRRDFRREYSAMLNVDNEGDIPISLTDEQNKIFNNIKSIDNPLYLEAKIIDGDKVEITKVHNIYDSDNIYYKFMIARRCFAVIFIISLIILLSEEKADK